MMSRTTDRTIHGSTRVALVLVTVAVLMASGALLTSIQPQVGHSQISRPAVETASGPKMGPTPVTASPGVSAIHPRDDPLGYVKDTLVLLNNTLVPGNFVAPNGGNNPTAPVFDYAKGEVFAASYYSGTVSVISVATDTVVATIGLPGGAGVGTAQGLAYDPALGEIFATNYNGNDVIVINDTTDAVVATPQVGYGPAGVAYDPAKAEMFIANNNDSTVSVLADVNNSVVATISVGFSPRGVLYDPTMGEIFVANSGSNSVSVISDATNNVVATILSSALLDPRWFAYDPTLGQVFLSEVDSNNVTVISDSTDSAIASVPVGQAPRGLAYDAATSQVFVADSVEGEVNVISVTSDIVVANVTLSTPPGGLALDNATDQIFTPDPYSVDVTVISDSTDSVVANIPLGTTVVNAAYDSGTQQVFVGNESVGYGAYFGPANVEGMLSAISGASDTIVASTAPSTAFDDLSPCGLTYDSGMGELFVASPGGFNSTSNVTVVSDTSDVIVSSIPVGFAPFATAYDPTANEVFVTNSYSDDMNIISDSSNTVIATVGTGDFPSGVAYDSGRGELFVTNAGSSNVTVVSAATDQAVAGVTLPGYPAPYCPAYDPTTGQVFVADYYSDLVSVISDANDSVVASIPVGQDPQAIAYDPSLDELFVTNSQSANVSVISADTDTVISSIPVGLGPLGLAYDSANGWIYVANSGSGTVSIIVPPQPYTVRFNESGLPNGALWEVTLGPSITGFNTTYNGSGAIAFSLTNGSYTYSVPNSWFVANPSGGIVTVAGANQTIPIGFTARPTVSLTVRENGLPPAVHYSWGLAAGIPERTAHTTGASLTLAVPVGVLSYALLPPPGWGVARVSGPNSPTQSSVNVTGAMVLHASFGLFGIVTFHQSGLPNGNEWGISVRTTFASGGPAPQNATAFNGSITFILVSGSWKFQVTLKPDTYKAVPGHGTVTLSAHVTQVDRKIVFKPIVTKVIFKERGLSETYWQVDINGPESLTLSTELSTNGVYLVNGTYGFSVYSNSSYTPNPQSGTFTVIAPGPTQVYTITFLAPPSAAVDRLSSHNTIAAASGDREGIAAAGPFRELT